MPEQEDTDGHTALTPPGLTAFVSGTAKEEMVCAYKAGIINEDSAWNITSYRLYTD